MVLEEGTNDAMQNLLNGKAKELATNIHLDNSMKATREGERIFLDLATIMAPEDSSINVTKKTGTSWWISLLWY